MQKRKRENGDEGAGRRKSVFLRTGPHLPAKKQKEGHRIEKKDKKRCMAENPTRAKI